METEHVDGAKADLLSMLAEAEAEPTGVQTFNRYVWQAKQAVRQWITCLAAPGGPLFIVCEHVEDLVLVYRDKFRFAQLKTKDKGSWSATAMASRGLDSLVRSYNSARQAGIHELATFELWLEGPISDDEDTTAFVENPRSAVRSVCDKLIGHGLKRNSLADFLARLAIFPDQPTRAHIDAKVIWELSAVWPALSRPELDLLYERLLMTVEAAQAATCSPASVQSHLAASKPTISRDLPQTGDAAGKAIEPIRNQILSYTALQALTPPLPGESTDSLLLRMSNGPGSSLLELKMKAAGARTPTVVKAQELRADMEVRRQLALASSDKAEAELDQLAMRLLTMAEATAARLAMAEAVSPATSARPADAITADLLSRPADLVQCDRAMIFQGESQHIFGYLCQLSDMCKFRWRAL